MIKHTNPILVMCVCVCVCVLAHECESAFVGVCAVVFGTARADSGMPCDLALRFYCSAGCIQGWKTGEASDTADTHQIRSALAFSIHAFSCMCVLLDSRSFLPSRLFQVCPRISHCSVC